MNWERANLVGLHGFLLLLIQAACLKLLANAKSAKTRLRVYILQLQSLPSVGSNFTLGRYKIWEVLKVNFIRANIVILDTLVSWMFRLHLHLGIKGSLQLVLRFFLGFVGVVDFVGPGIIRQQPVFLFRLQASQLLAHDLLRTGHAAYCSVDKHLLDYFIIVPGLFEGVPVFLVYQFEVML